MSSVSSHQSRTNNASANSSTTESISRGSEQQQQDGDSRVSPSHLNVYNLDKAGGNLEIYNRDSGVARHPLFYKFLRATKTKKTTPDMEMVVYEDYSRWSKKKKSLSLGGALVGSISGSDHPVMDDSLFRDLYASIRDVYKDAGRDSPELFFSEGISRCLGSFCNRHRLPFTFSHQYPCGRSSKVGSRPSEAADAVDVAALLSKDDQEGYFGGNVLLGMILVNSKGGEEHNDEDAKWRVCGYISEATASLRIDEFSRVSFCLIVDRFNIRLFGFTWTARATLTGKRGVLEHALLWLEPFNKPGGCSKLLQAYFLGLFMLSDEDVRAQQPGDHFCPLVNEKVTRVHPKVFKSLAHPPVMYKVFDSGETTRKRVKKPNLKIAQILYGDDRAALDCDDDMGVCVLKMPWIEGEHVPTNCDQMICLCRNLEKLHAKGRKHGDVHCRNVVFHESGGGGGGASLIDFDFAHLHKYPWNWNTNFPERHCNSYPGCQMVSHHDAYAAIAITCRYFELRDKANIYEEFVERGDLEVFKMLEAAADGKEDEDVKEEKCPFTATNHPNLNRTWENAKIVKLTKWLAQNKENLIARQGAMSGAKSRRG